MCHVWYYYLFLAGVWYWCHGYRSQIIWRPNQVYVFIKIIIIKNNLNWLDDLREIQSWADSIEWLSWIRRFLSIFNNASFHNFWLGISCSLSICLSCSCITQLFIEFFCLSFLVIFPQDLLENGLAAKNFAMLGLGDIVIPGIFIAILLRYDYRWVVLFIVVCCRLRLEYR